MSIPGSEVHLTAEQGGLVINQLREQLYVKTQELIELRELNASYAQKISNLESQLERTEVPVYMW